MSKMNNKTTDKISLYDKLVVDIRNNLTTRLADLMSKLLNSAQDKLFSLSDEADNNEDQTRYFELMNQVQNLKPEIAETFNARVRDYLIPKGDFEEKQKKLKKEEDEELSLVDPDEMEGLVLVKGIGERAAAKYREQLSHLEARFEHLGLKTDTVFKEDALKPTNFCQAFDDALADHFDTANKRLLFQMFDVEVANKLDALYDSINNRLIDADILPQIKLSIAGKKSASRPSHARPPPPSEAPENPETMETGASGGDYGDTANAGPAGAVTGGAGKSAGGPQGGQQGGPQSGTNIGGFAMAAAPGGGYRGANYAAQGGADGAQAGAGAPGGGATAPEGSSAAAGGMAGGSAGSNGMHRPGTTDGGDSGDGDGSEYQHYTAGLPANQVGRVLSNYIGAPFTPAARDKNSESYGEFFPASTPQYFGHQEILQALTGLQNLPQFNQPEQVAFDSEAIKQAVLAEIARTSGGAVTKRINQIAEKTIDFIELIFDAIIDDEDISDTIKALLLRLQIPIIKASMADQEFFIYDDHPARVLLDTIAEVGVGITEHTDEIYIHLDKIVSGILGEFDLTTETFQKALDKLHRIIEEQEAVARAKEEEQQQLLRKHARATVLKALRATTAGKTLPEPVHPLILKRWPTLMFNHYLKNGKENNGWVNMVLTLRNIVESVQPVTTPEQLAKRQEDKEALFEQTECYLNSVSRSKKDVQNIMAAFRDTVEAMIADANFSEEEVSSARQVIAESPPEEEPVIEEATEDKAEIPPNVMPGMWFQVYMGDDQASRRCKLSVIIVEDANLMFVNHKGELVVEKSFDEFNEELASEKSKVIMGHSAFDYAFKTVINRLN